MASTSSGIRRAIIVKTVSKERKGGDNLDYGLPSPRCMVGPIATHCPCVKIIHIDKREGSSELKTASHIMG
jgi:hypothetical protein